MEVALYYPYMVPPLEWMRQSLLFFDATSSIVPPEYRNARDIPAAATNNYRTDLEDLRWLEDEGHWRPVSSEGVWDLKECTYDLFRAIAALVKAKNLDNLRTVHKGLLVGGKLRPQFEERLISSHLATDQGEYLEMPVDAVWSILSIIATYIAKEPHFAFGDNSVRATTSTDSTDYFNFVTQPFSVPPNVAQGDSWLEEVEQKELELELNRSGCYQVLLDGLLPVPGPNVSLPDIVAFRNSYIDELLAFRVAVNGMVQEALQSPEPRQTIMDNRAKIESALVQIHRAAQSRKIKLGAAAVTVATGVAVTASFGGAETIKWVFDGLGGAVAISLIASALRYPRKRSDMSYLVKSHSITESGEVPVPALTARSADTPGFRFVPIASPFA